MGKYYGVKKVKELGRQIMKYEFRPVDEDKVDEAPFHIIAILNNGLYSVAHDVTTQKEFNYTDTAYGNGFWLSMDLYQVPTEALGSCPDEGRVYD